MVCEKCRVKIPEDSLFCPSCGNKVVVLFEEERNDSDDNTDSPKEDTSKQEVIDEKTPMEKAIKKKKPWEIYGLCVVVLLISLLLINKFWQPFIKGDLNNDTIHEVFNVKWGMTKKEVLEKIGKGANDYGDSIMVFSSEKNRHFDWLNKCW